MIPTLRNILFSSLKIRMFEVTIAYDCEFQQVFYGVRCGFDAWSFTFGLHWSLLHSAHPTNVDWDNR